MFLADGTLISASAAPHCGCEPSVKIATPHERPQYNTAELSTQPWQVMAAPVQNEIKLWIQVICESHLVMMGASLLIPSFVLITDGHTSRFIDPLSPVLPDTSRFSDPSNSLSDTRRFSDPLTAVVLDTYRFTDPLTYCYSIGHKQIYQSSQLLL